MECLAAYGEECIFGGDWGEIKKWDLKTGNCVVSMRGHNVAVLCLIVHEEALYSGSWDTTVRKWSLHGTAMQVYNAHAGHVLSLIVWNGALFQSGSAGALDQLTGLHFFLSLSFFLLFLV